MSLNKSKGNMYPWVTGTWNPLIGKCPHNCAYCSTNKFYYPNLVKRYSGKPRLDENAFTDNLGSCNIWFVCAQNDLFANDITGEFVYKILKYCSEFANTYLFQSKNPDGFIGWGAHMPDSIILCTTIETNRVYPDIMNNAPDPIVRAIKFASIPIKEKYITIEPIMDFDLISMIELIRICHPAQVNIGADSGNNHLPEPEWSKVKELISALEEFTTVKLKTNLRRIEK